MRYQRAVKGAAVALLVLGAAANAFAGPATDRLKPEIDRVLAAVDNPALRAEARAAERRQAIRTVTDGIFDWTEMAERALGRHWEERTRAEQAEFVVLFRELLEKAYVAKIERYGGEPIAYTGESVEGDEAVVRTRVTVKPGQDVSVDYRMSGQRGRWMVYDVVIENVSLVSNYRTQFEGVLKSASYAELLKKIRTRLS